MHETTVRIGYVRAVSLAPPGLCWDSEINIALFHYLTQRALNSSANRNSAFWVGLSQREPGEEYIEPENGFRWEDYSELDLIGVNLWMSGQPDDRDDDTGKRNVSCACYDALRPVGLFDCSCTKLRIPVCAIYRKIFYDDVYLICKQMELFCRKQT
jgi:hypothetical protein